jgi:glycosyltransferase involved in cell wall biosynthesis
LQPGVNSSRSLAGSGLFSCAVPGSGLGHETIKGLMRFLMLNWRDPQNPLAGGAERVSVAYLAALVKRGHEVCWFANHFEGGTREEIVDGITCIRSGGKGGSVLKAIQWYRRQNRFDLVIDQHHGIPWFAPWWCNTHCVAYIHEVLGPIWNAFYSWPLNVLGRWQEYWTHRFYRNIPFWVPSEATRRRLMARGVRSVTVFPNGCDTVPLTELEPKPLQAPLQLISVSRLASNKRVDHAIRTVKCLLDRGIAARLQVVGTGEVAAALRQTARQLNVDGQIAFSGLLPEKDKNDALRRAHLLVHTSIREGWGLNVLEANAMGTPAIVYPVDGLMDSTVDGQTGIIAPAETPESLADALQTLLRTPGQYDAFRRNAWNRSKQFQWAEVLPPVCRWLEERAAGKKD